MEISYKELKEDTLRNIIEEFVTREGTDYGHVNISLAKKIDDVKKLLDQGKVVLVYDDESKTCNIIES
jgi:uncharacterized protein